MKVVILAGGLGTRLAEETEIKPKPMVEIGGHPIIWHIMKHYVHHGFSEFVVALGYKGDDIKRYFLDYHRLGSNVTVDLASGKSSFHEAESDPWAVHLIDTGAKTQTGGRVKRLQPWLEGGTFMLTYGDGVSDVDFRELLAFHRAHGRLATITGVHPPARFGDLAVEGSVVRRFAEKPVASDGYINGGFFVFERRVLDYLDPGEDCILESKPLERLAAEGQLRMFGHPGFWQCMDTPRDMALLNDLWNSGRAPWSAAR
jgi:glucose-1-phosphate cytidylyltransferase